MAGYQTYVPDHNLIHHLVTEYANANMLVTVGITRYDPPAFNAYSGQLDPGSTTKLYTGIARIATLSGPMAMDYGEERTYWQQAMAYIPLDSAPTVQVNDRLDVIESRTNHPGIVGRTYRITDVQRAGQWPASVALTLVGVQPQPSATGTVGSEWWQPLI